MKVLLITFSLLFSFNLLAQKSQQDVEQLRNKHLEELLDTSTHVLKLEEIETFGGLDYFKFDMAYQVEALFTKDKGKKFEMITSTERRPVYRRYGYVVFTINNIECTLEVYQNLALKKNKDYKDYLFIPFRDKTSGNSTYGGGRYLDIRIPDGNEIILDFNLLYNPYCAYSYRYSCPIPPEANKLEVEIKAGEKTPIGH